MDAPVASPGASRLPVRPHFHSKTTFGCLPPPPTSPFPLGVRARGRGCGGAHPHTLSLSHSFPVTNKADARNSPGTM